MSHKVNARNMRIFQVQADDIQLPKDNFRHLLSCKKHEKSRHKEVEKMRKKQENQKIRESPGYHYQEIEDVTQDEILASIDAGQTTQIQEEAKSDHVSIRISDEGKKEVPVNEKNVGQSLYVRGQQLKSVVPMINSSVGLCAYNGICYDVLTEEDIIKLYREHVDKKLGGEKNLSSISQLYRSLRTDPDIPVIEDKANNDRIVNLLNGIYDVEEQRLYPHSKEYISFSYIKANYKRHEKCPEFDRFVSQVTRHNPILEERLWMSLGYILMQTNEAKVFFVMGEAPDSGKSVFGRFIESLYDEKYISNASLNNFGKEFALSTLLGAAINLSLDLPSKQINGNAIANLKMLTGGDAINMNQKNIPEQRFVNRAKFIFATNNPIQIPREDTAFWNRLIYLPFNISVPKNQQNPHLLEEFEREKNAIVTKAIKHARKLIHAGYEFPTAAEIEERIKIWRGIESDTVEPFLKRCCEVNAECKGEIVSDLYADYTAYCKKMNWVCMKRIEFKKYLEEKIQLEHFKMRRNKGDNPQSAFRGIKLLNESEV